MIINFLLIRCVLFFKASCIFIGSGRWKSDKPPTLYIFINCSTRDLAYIEKYVVRSVGIRKSKSSYFSLPYLQDISSKSSSLVYQCVVILTYKCHLFFGRKSIKRLCHQPSFSWIVLTTFISPLPLDRKKIKKRK